MIVHQSETRYQAIFECIQDAVFLMQEGLFVDCNAATLRIFGCGREQIIGQSPEEFSPRLQPDGEDSRTKASRKIMEALGGTPQRFEWRHRKHNGDEFDAEVSLDRFQENGRPMLLAVVRDISEEKQAGQRLASAEAKYRSLVENTSDWVWEVDEHGRYTYCSPKVKEMLGYDPQEMIGKTPFDFMVSEDITRVQDTFANCVRRREKIVALKNAAFRKTGEKVVLETSGEPILDGNQITGYRGIDRDITARELAEEALRTREEQLRLLVKHAPAAIAMFDTEMRYLAVSNRFLKDYRLGTRNIIGLSHYDVFPEIRSMKSWIDIHKRCLEGAVENCEEDPFYTPRWPYRLGEMGNRPLENRKGPSAA